MVLGTYNTEVKMCLWNHIDIYSKILIRYIIWNGPLIMSTDEWAYLDGQKPKPSL